MDAEHRWTLDELVELVADALAGTAYPGAPNGRVRDVPDRRAVRWYATIGLVDRPAAARGRSARYGVRHLWQLVAVKRRQAQGRTLAEIQAELTGATDATLRRVAAVSDEWLAAALAPARPTDDTADTTARTRFWAQPAPAAQQSAPPVLTGVPLGPGAVLLLPARPEPEDLRAIHAAAQPLLTLLANRGLLDAAANLGPLDAAAGPDAAGPDAAELDAAELDTAAE